MHLSKGPSLFHNWLTELSFKNDLLPTKTSTGTFIHDYLGPALDPLLHPITVINDFLSGPDEMDFV